MKERKENIFQTFSAMFNAINMHGISKIKIYFEK